MREDHIPYSIDVIGPDQAGIVAGLAGFLTQGTGVLCTLAVSLWYGHSALPMVWVLIAANILGVTIMSWGLSGGQRAGKKPGA